MSKWIWRAALAYVLVWLAMMWFTGAAFLPPAPKDRPLSSTELSDARASIAPLTAQNITDVFASDQPVILYSMASWCSICARQGGILKEYAATPNALPIRAIAFDDNTDALAQKLALWNVADYSAQVFQLQKPDYAAFATMLESYGCTPAKGVPSFYMIHPDGTCRMSNQGPLMLSQLTALSEKL